jgi:hypothetical protein
MFAGIFLQNLHSGITPHAITGGWETAFLLKEVRMNRKSLLFGLGGACLTVLAFGAPGARAQVINIDENATQDPNNPTIAPGVFPDPTAPQGTSPTTGYILPFPTVPGDVHIFEPPVGTGSYSDLLRFLPQGTGGSTLLLIYSNAASASDPSDSKADVGIPENVVTPVFTAFETGLGGAPYTEDSNGLFYTPTPNQPGGLPTGATIAYNFISDNTPEPGMLCLTPAVAGLLMRNRRRNNPA